MSKQANKVVYQPDPKNARRHGDRNKQMIRASLEEVGAFRSIGVDGDDIVRAGNGVYEQAQALGLKVREIEDAPDELIAVKRPDLRGDAAIKAALWDNRTSETSEPDYAVLADYASLFDLSAMYDAGEQDEIATLTDGTHMRDAEPRRNLGEKAKQIKPVLSMEDIATFEHAIRATGERNRGKAIMLICQEYLDAHSERQLDFSL